MGRCDRTRNYSNRAVIYLLDSVSEPGSQHAQISPECAVEDRPIEYVLDFHEECDHTRNYCNRVVIYLLDSASESGSQHAHISPESAIQDRPNYFVLEIH